MSIEKKIQFYIDNLNCLDETIEKYKFLLDQGKKAKLFPEEFRQENFKVKGCQSQVWVVPYLKDNLLSFHTDSDAFLTKGSCDQLIFWHLSKTRSDFYQH